MTTQWHAVPLTLLLDEGEMVRVEVAGVALVIGFVGERYHAFAATCPHASAELVEGTLRPGYVVCPLHAYRYELKRGQCIKPPFGPRLRLYEVRERDGRLWVRMDG